jgi:hypothetical protein
MDKIAINRGWLEQVNAPPPLCLKTGQPTEGNVQQKVFTTAPSWTLGLIVLGLIPFVIARAAAGDRITMQIPRYKASMKASGWYQWVALLGGIVGIVGATIGSGNSNALVALVGVGVIVGSIGLAIWKTNENNVGIRMKHRDPIVVLSR